MIKLIVPSGGPFPLSKAILHNYSDVLEISGQIGVDPKTGILAEGIEAQTTQTLQNIKTILEEVGWSLSNVIKTNVYLSDMSDYTNMNEVYAQYFTKDFPTRSAFAVKELPRGALIEIECTACGEYKK